MRTPKPKFLRVKETTRSTSVLIYFSNFRTIKERNEELQTTISDLHIKNATANSQVYFTNEFFLFYQF